MERPGPAPGNTAATLLEAAARERVQCRDRGAEDGLGGGGCATRETVLGEEGADLERRAEESRCEGPGWRGRLDWADYSSWASVQGGELARRERPVDKPQATRIDNKPTIGNNGERIEGQYADTRIIPYRGHWRQHRCRA